MALDIRNNFNTNSYRHTHTHTHAKFIDNKLNQDFDYRNLTGISSDNFPTLNIWWNRNNLGRGDAFWLRKVPPQKNNTYHRNIRCLRPVCLPWASGTIQEHIFSTKNMRISQFSIQLQHRTFWCRTNNKVLATIWKKAWNERE